MPIGICARVSLRCLLLLVPGGSLRLAMATDHYVLRTTSHSVHCDAAALTCDFAFLDKSRPVQQGLGPASVTTLAIHIPITCHAHILCGAVQDACAALARECGAGDEVSGFRRSRRPLYGAHMVLLALRKPGTRNMFAVRRPNTGHTLFDLERSELDAK